VTRDGGSMNCMVPSTPCIHPNSSMTEEQLVIAAAFVQELVDLGVLVPGFILTIGPLFVLEKANQPGQWRLLSDMKSGGQNSVVSNDSVFLNRTSHILDSTSSRLASISVCNILGISTNSCYMRAFPWVQATPLLYPANLVCHSFAC
jgi:hypothetical protein